MKDIAIYGAGGFGKEVVCLIDRINKSQSKPQWRLIGFFDDGKPIGTTISRYGSVLGGITELNAWPKPLDITIAIGTPTSIKSIRAKTAVFVVVLFIVTFAVKNGKGYV